MKNTDTSMKTKSGIILLFFFSALVISCQREVSEELPVNNIIEDSLLLWKFIQIDTTKPTGSDTVARYVFTYDDQKRLKQSLYTAIYESVSGPRVATSNTDYYYAGADTLPFKTVEVLDDINVYSDTTFLLYENGIVVYDSSIQYNITDGQPEQVSVILYTNSGNTTFVKTKSAIYSPFTPVVVEEHSGNVVKQLVAGNIVRQVDTTGSSNKVTNSDIYENVYDNKINPFYIIEPLYPVYGGFNSATNHQRNNVTEEKSFITISGLAAHKKFSYEYRQDGYPVRVRLFDVLDPSGNTQFVYFYTR